MISLVTELRGECKTKAFIDLVNKAKRAGGLNVVYIRKETDIPLI